MNPERRHHKVWLFDLDNTLHNASASAFGGINDGMSDYIVRELGTTRAEADELRRRYLLRYGATLLGLVRHHDVKPAHFLHHTHVLPGLEQRVHGHQHDLAALMRLPGRRYIVTNAPRAYAQRVLSVLMPHGPHGWRRAFDGLISIEDLRMFGHLRPKPDARMLRRLAVLLRVAPEHCVLVEDTLEHQKAARSVGMGTVWMQRWLRLAQRPGRPGPLMAAARVSRRPAYVDRRVHGLRELLRHMD